MRNFFVLLTVFLLMAAAPAMAEHHEHVKGSKMEKGSMKDEKGSKVSMTEEEMEEEIDEEMGSEMEQEIEDGMMDDDEIMEEEDFEEFVPEEGMKGSSQEMKGVGKKMKGSGKEMKEMHSNHDHEHKGSGHEKKGSGY